MVSADRSLWQGCQNWRNNFLKQPMSSKDKSFQLLRQFGLRANKGLGQNFLIDDSVVEKIVAAAQIQSTDIILEVGPGLGTLTEALAQSGCKRVVAVELDRRLIPALQELKKQYDNLEIINEDILKLDIKELFGDQPFKVVANLPYYITTPIIMYFIEGNLSYERLVVMVQKEVAERMASEPGGKSYGALSVAVQYRTEAQVAFIVPPDSFLPAPSVESAVIVCKRRTQSPVKVKSEADFFRIVRAAFSQRRKIISNSLKNIGFTAEQTTSWLQAAEIDGQRRAETLSLADFARLEENFDRW